MGQDRDAAMGLSVKAMIFFEDRIPLGISRRRITAR